MSLAKPVAETVARHLVATGLLIDEDPAEALAHALAARRLAARIAAVREAVGLAAYHAGEWQTGIAELRTYHRMSGLQSHLAVLADCERALGRPERAVDLFRGADREKLDQPVAIELLIVAAGARGDLGQKDAAVAMLQVPELTTDSSEPWAARLRYAYADALLAVGRRAEAREWFSRAADVDAEGETDAAERLLELDGVVIEGDDEEDDDLDAVDDEPEDDARAGHRDESADLEDGDDVPAGYRDRDGTDLGDDELTDADAGSLAADVRADAPAEVADAERSGDDTPITADEAPAVADGDAAPDREVEADRR
ncbi:Replicase polyprotein 1ab [Micromonospora sp. NPDC048999]|uniref:Replicase polyprotein 1ab n=1 Tax=Micromonospora sp. NPDC048999 TaxID=3155391 RepID=UPI0033DF0288